MNDTEIVKFTPNEIDEAIIGLDALQDILMPLLERLNYEGQGKSDAVHLIKHLDMAKHALMLMGGVLDGSIDLEKCAGENS